MKTLISLFCFTMIALSAHAGDKKEAKSARKPANSSWIYCTLYSTSEAMNRIEFAEDSRTSQSYVNVNGRPAEMVSLTAGSLKFKLDGEAVTLTTVEGSTKRKESGVRGETRVFELVGYTEYTGFKFFGACSAYNF